MPTPTIAEAHARATRMDIHEVTRQLNLHLGPTLVAHLADAGDRRMPVRWARADGPQPRSAAERRLRYAHRVWTEVATAESDHVARAWFIGANPRLDESSPVLAIREERFADVSSAAHAFVEDTATL